MDYKFWADLAQTSNAPWAVLAVMLLWAWLKYLRSDNRLYLKIAKRSNADEAVAILLALRGKENDKSADKDTETSTAGPPPQPAPPRRGVHRLWHWLRQRFRN